MFDSLHTHVFVPAILALSLGLGIGSSAVSYADTQVTTYVIKTQEERTQTRWSLTEWLKIKERMKAMDLWLAIFSDPKKDHFQPELMLSFAATRSQFNYTKSTGQSESGSLNGGALKAQLWLTNLISSTIGVRTLNVDLGAEAYHRTSGAFNSTSTTGSTSSTGAATSVTSSSSAASARHFDLEYYTGDLRIFGRNIQDSSLVLKYGRYSLRDGILDPVSETATGTIAGPVAAAELQLYVLHALGAEGNYVQYGNASEKGGYAKVNGAYYDYMGFIEVSLLRLFAGPYVETWTMTTGLGESLKTQEKGLQGGLKLQF